MHTHRFANRSPRFYAAVVAVSLFPLYLASYQYRLHHPYGGIQTDTLYPAFSDTFVQQWLDTHVIQPFNQFAAGSYCNRTEWHSNLVFNLVGGAKGDFAEQRQSILNFLFYAVEAGASVVLPSIAKDKQASSSIVKTNAPSFGMLFDEELLRETMAHVCPGMAIYKPEKDHKMADALPGTYKPKSRRMDVASENTKEAYMKDLDGWLKSKKEFKPDELTLVNVKPEMWPVDTRSLPQVFRRNFGQLLRTAPAIRRVAAMLVQGLAASYPSTHVKPQEAIPRHAFFGADPHIPSNASQQSEMYFNISAQADAYIEQALKHELRVMYVASSNFTELAHFKDLAAARSSQLQIVSKFDLLAKADQDALRQLTLEQQALLDFEMLKRCSVFGGFIQSTGGFTVALARNQWLVHQGRMNDPWYVMHKEDGVVFDDGISRVLGRDGEVEQQVMRGMWP